MKNRIAPALLTIVLLCGLFLIMGCTPGWEESGVRSNVSRVRAEQRSVATALEAYYVDNRAYPLWATGNRGVNASLPPRSPERSRPTFRIHTSPSDVFHTLTTPLAYLTRYFPDPFAHAGFFPPCRNATFSYYADDNGWILVSTGPDHDYDIDPQALYDSSILQPSPALLRKAYDPTNGIVSDGDIFRVRQ